MKWATYISPATRAQRAGLIVDDRIFGLEQGVSLLGLLGDDGSALAAAGEKATRDPREVVAVEDVELCAPIPQPPSIRDSASFEAHLRAGFAAFRVPFDFDNWYQHPMVYFTNPHGLTGSGATIPAAAGSQWLDYELEVAAVVGRAGADVDVTEAEELIAGYCIFNDWSARDIQGHEVKFQVGPFKTKDWAMTTGPFLVTKDELEPFRKGNSFDLEMKAFVNGRQYSKGNLSDMYWSFAELVAYSSRGTWVKPGDLIASGTVGTGCILELSATNNPDEYPWLTAGDEVVLEVEGLGRLVNSLVEPPPVREWRRKSTSVTP
ncbi:fumarylacetoacetate hydrolase family protein [Amycolatopsis pithecellobii]|uniref:Fumarylacetoacetate hydrolase family protein n=1 Tax=Amycolatopsis pithecellobii TaxID=664692 RepID=A0A6N7YK09_9PSEU|nr:fumarylacetoacetate hydrolase family protein [Amycolatopsis pithecellobii]MTD53245.1 fumarylacetoacetate hydrolase family protein [Amycolatopsis pithecellobii]